MKNSKLSKQNDNIYHKNMVKNKKQNKNKNQTTTK